MVAELIEWWNGKMKDYGSILRGHCCILWFFFLLFFSFFNAKLKKTLFCQEMCFLYVFWWNKGIFCCDTGLRKRTQVFQLSSWKNPQGVTTVCRGRLGHSLMENFDRATRPSPLLFCPWAAARFFRVALFPILLLLGTVTTIVLPSSNCNA
jgi:hypothetical protein